MSYSIGEFSALIDLSIDTLRYYEKEQLIQVGRDAGGRRRYQEVEIVTPEEMLTDETGI